ncbi:hypothetical protein DFJ73DRAFT_793752 [Zopfochytrium polystomum]|nr:hypothetical protein DFJ73DRAFT_793752 [Zopfochytrium polystomum]
MAPPAAVQSEVRGVAHGANPTDVKEPKHEGWRLAAPPQPKCEGRRREAPPQPNWATPQGAVPTELGGAARRRPILEREGWRREAPPDPTEKQKTSTLDMGGPSQYTKTRNTQQTAAYLRIPASRGDRIPRLRLVLPSAAIAIAALSGAPHAGGFAQHHSLPPSKPSVRCLSSATSTGSVELLVADEDEEIAIIPGGATAAVVAKLSSSHLRVAVLGKDEALLLLYIDDEGDFVHLESDTDVRLMGASEESLDDNRALASGGAVSLSLTLVAVQSRTDSNTGRTGRGKGEPSKFGSLLAPVVIASLKMPVEAANLAEYVVDLESQLAQLREIVLGTPAQSPPPQQQQQQAVPAPGARAAEPDAKITKMSENNSNNNDDDGVPAAPDAGAAAHEGSTAEGVAAVVADHQALAGAAGEAVMTPDTRPSRRQHHRLFAATAAAIDHTENQPGRHRLARILVIIVIAVRVPGQLSHTCTLAPSNKGAHT